jgi:hypothetical protein
VYMGPIGPLEGVESTVVAPGPEPLTTYPYSTLVCAGPIRKPGDLQVISTCCILQEPGYTSYPPPPT